MSRRFLCSALVLCSFTLAAQDRPPNVVLMLVDDMGWTDMSCGGSKYYETPNIDRLAKDGMRFTNAYSACTVCSPTRAAILTGKSPARLHITDWIAGHQRPFAKLSIPEWTQNLPLEEETLAEKLKAKGYATASIGKWHLGGPEFYPEKQGFDVNIGGMDKGSPPSYFSPYGLSTLTDGPKGEFLTDRLTTEAIKFIEAHQETPFFVYLPHYAVHAPIQAKPEVVAKYQKKAAVRGHFDPVYAALVESVDDSVGRLRVVLEKLELSDDTLFIFTSDNGGLSHLVNARGWSRGPTDNSPARLGKGSAYDGGVRVPLIAAWPEIIPQGEECDTPVISYDLLPTVLAAAALPIEPNQIIDGESLMPLLTQKNTLKRDAIYWHYPHYHPGGATPYSAVREGDWKLIEFYEDGHLELYNLRRDPGEFQNMAEVEGDVTERLQQLLQKWRLDVEAQEPESNPEFDPERAFEAAKKERQ